MAKKRTARTKKHAVRQRDPDYEVGNAKAGEGSGSERMARYIVDREEGKAVEHLIIDDASELTDDECEELRKLIRGKHGRDVDQ